MNPRKRIFLLTAIMAFLVAATSIITIGILYKTAINQEVIRLTETAKSQARLIESIAQFNKKYAHDYPSNAPQATLEQIREAHSKYEGFGDTGEFTLAKKEGDQIVFLISHRHYDLDKPKPVQWNSKIAAPMRAALSGKSGHIIGLDYRGVTVLASHEPVADLNFGIVAKIDLDEVRAPFIQAGLVTAILALFLILIGVTVFFRLTNPILKNLSNTVERLQKALDEVKVLRGIIPICAYCKKIRDDEGYWDQVEVYIKKHSDADFSHGICPTCFQKHFPK
nr:hypothetical protein [uncultured Desulfobulbus sp.]